MTPQSPPPDRPDAAGADLFEREVYLGLRRRAAFASGLAVVCLVLALLAVAALAALAPLKSTEAFLVIVDRSTGETERVAALAPIALTEREALTEASLVGYVSDRETFDPVGAEARVNSVLDRSAGRARADWIALWTPGNPLYPPKLYGPEARITVKVTSVSLLEPGVAQVRLVKTRAGAGGQSVAAAFVATIGFEFAPTVARRLEALWANPFGFAVTGYRIDAETLDARRIEGGPDARRPEGGL